MKKNKNIFNKILTSIRENAIILRTNERTNERMDYIIKLRKEGNHWFNCSPYPRDRGCKCLIALSGDLGG